MFGRRGSEVARSENCSLKIMVSKLQQGVYSNYNYYNSHSKNNSTDYIHSYKKPGITTTPRLRMSSTTSVEIVSVELKK